MTKAVLKALQVAKDLRIKVVFKDPITPDHWGLSKKDYERLNREYEALGRWDRGRTILINPRKADAYTVLHEIGHVINGFMCCREHCEYAAHGAALALARTHGIRISKYDRQRIDVYASRSVCPISR